MKLHMPFSISARLLPALRLPDSGTIQLEYSRNPGRDGRTRYRWTVDLPCGFTATGEDLQSGCGGGSLQEGFESFCSFLGAAAESYRYRGLDWNNVTEDDNAHGWDRKIVEWAYQNSDELGMLSIELEETPNLIQE